MLEHLCILVAHEKVGGLACWGTFLGVVINTEAFELQLPKEKIAKLRSLLEVWMGSKTHRVIGNGHQMMTF